MDAADGCPRVDLLCPGRRKRRPPRLRHAALCQLPCLRRRLLDGGAAAFVCFALQHERCATVKGGLNVHHTCLSTSALLTVGNVAAPATDPFLCRAHMPTCRHPNSRTARLHKKAEKSRCYQHLLAKPSQFSLVLPTYNLSTTEYSEEPPAREAQSVLAGAPRALTVSVAYILSQLQPILNKALTPRE